MRKSCRLLLNNLFPAIQLNEQQRAAFILYAKGQQITNKPQSCPVHNFQGTGYAPLHTLGIAGIASGASPLSVAGWEDAARAATLYMFGILGSFSGAVPIHLEVTDTGVLAGGTALYAHGY